jgi:hypothetical protein
LVYKFIFAVEGPEADESAKAKVDEDAPVEEGHA